MPSPKVLTLAELKTTAEYHACSLKQRLWLDTLIESDFDWSRLRARPSIAETPNKLEHFLMPFASSRISSLS